MCFLYCFVILFCFFNLSKFLNLHSLVLCSSLIETSNDRKKEITNNKPLCPPRSAPPPPPMKLKILNPKTRLSLPIYISGSATPPSVKKKQTRKIKMRWCPSSKFSAYFGESQYLFTASQFIFPVVQTLVMHFTFAIDKINNILPFYAERT